MSKTVIKECDCKHAYQDKRYGERQRVMNVADKKKVGSNAACSCTVCGTLKVL